MEILDSGNRRTFDTGAVRDIQEGKGRCDLIPLDVMAKATGDVIIKSISNFVKTNDTQYLYAALRFFSEQNYEEMYTMYLNVAKHFEAGAIKYGENNWQKGLPVGSYVDSMLRHYLKFCRGDNDEPHNSAFVWNVICCVWEVDHHVTD